MLRREVAKRIFATEFNDANMIFKESDDKKAPGFLLTPLGEKCNRMFVVGTLLQKELASNGQDWKAKVSDPTGVFWIYTGQFNPDAIQSIMNIDSPSYVAVVGKPRIYRPENSDVLYTSLRAENICKVDEEVRDFWVLETYNATVRRIKRMDANSDVYAQKARMHYYKSDDEYNERRAMYMKLLVESLDSVSNH